MKQLIKSIFPQSALNIGRAVVDRTGLLRLSKKSFDLKNLCKITAINLDEIFKNKNTKDSWDVDRKAINQAYGSEDKLGGVNPGDRQALYYLITALQPKQILEVGTHIGASTLHIARALKAIGSDGKIDTVDVIDVNHPENGSWRNIGLSKNPQGFAKSLGCEDFISFHAQPCQEFMAQTTKGYDFIFLDGDHRAPAVYKEISAALELLNENGVILLHDYYPEGRALYKDNNVIYGPFFALKRIEKEVPDIKILPLGSLPWPTKQGSSHTTLALLVKGDDKARIARE